MSLKGRIPILLVSIFVGGCIVFYGGLFVIYNYYGGVIAFGTQRTVSEGHRSPNGAYVAYLETLDFQGGATVGYNYEVIVVPASKKFNKDRDKEWVWWSSEVPPKRFYWKNSKTIEVVVSRPEVPVGEVTQTRRRYGIGAKTKVIE